MAQVAVCGCTRPREGRVDCGFVFSKNPDGHESPEEQVSVKKRACQVDLSHFRVDVREIRERDTDGNSSAEGADRSEEKKRKKVGWSEKGSMFGVAGGEGGCRLG
ncbi:hypothetical protein CDL15_Pgr010858 [Punica granatum]|uniref:Uncharacterized protein n=1 Tax=Punica granatum TaxID=22663 RepID=A0A218W6J6_PUNGR|nr:hypothetical protein CDL15_Pgr010858 [Punica granatum]